MPALFAALEPLETDGNLFNLQAPLGVVVTGLEAVTTKTGDTRHMDQIVGTARANQMRAACHGRDCQMMGAHFTIQKNGMFDSFSKIKGGDPKKSACANIQRAPSGLPFLQSITKSNGECTDPGDCFGWCGLGCSLYNIGVRVWTTSCYFHDFCVCAFSWGECVWFDASNPPTGMNGPCYECATLVQAIIDFFGEFADMLVQWFNDTFGGEVPDVKYQ